MFNIHVVPLSILELFLWDTLTPSLEVVSQASTWVLQINISPTLAWLLVPFTWGKYLEKKPRVLYLDHEAAWIERNTRTGLSIWNHKAPNQSHTSSNKATPIPPSSATPYEPKRAIFIQITTFLSLTPIGFYPGPNAEKHSVQLETSPYSVTISFFFKCLKSLLRLKLSPSNIKKKKEKKKIRSHTSNI